LVLIFFLLAQPLREEVLPKPLEGGGSEDTTYEDTIRGGVSEVRFAADTIIFYTDTKDVLLLNNGSVSYGDLTVYSDSIMFSTQKRLLSAYKGARLESETDSLLGDVLQYAVETHKGVMEKGRTQIEQGYFAGEGVWLVEENTIHITRGYYTTCERYPPHYDFYGSELKVILNDMVIARPILLRVRRIPVLAAPFWYLPIGNKRKSGLMPFKFGHSDEEGWFAKMIRYYWVTNDYSDVLFQLDIMTHKGFRPGAYLNWIYGPRGAEYAAGSFNANYINEIDTRTQHWELALKNTSNIPDGTKITADINFTSDYQYKLNYIEDEDSLTILLDQRTRSDVSISRTILGRSVNLSAFREDNLETGYWRMKLPGFNFSWPVVTLWDFITLNFGSFGVTNTYTHDVPTDTLQPIVNSRATNFNQPLTLSWGYTFFSAYRFSQSWGAGQSLEWREEEIQDSLALDTLIRGADYSLTNSISTDFYRIFGIRILGMNGVLHTVSPTISYTIKPATDQAYPWVVYPRFDTTLASHTLNLTIAQNFQTKFRASGDTTRFRKQDLLNLSTGIGYNLLTDSLTPVQAIVELPHGLPIYARLSADYYIYTDSFTINTHVSASVDQVLFPLFGLRERKAEPDTTDTLGEAYLEPSLLDTLEEVADTVSPDTFELAEDRLYHPEPKKEPFLKRLSQSRLYLENSLGVRSDSLGGVGKSSHMLSARTQLFLPLEMELNLSVGFNLTEPQDTFKNYIASYNMSLVKGLHCWEAVFEVTPRDGLSLAPENLEWNIYVRIKELPDIQFGKGMFKQLGE
jgi:hypothetical protein